METDDLLVRMDRDGSALVGSPFFGDVLICPATVRDKTLAMFSQADASGKIAWVLRNLEDVNLRAVSPVFDGLLGNTGWGFCLENQTTTRVTLAVKKGEAYPCCLEGEGILDRLYVRLCATHDVAHRLIIAPSASEEIDREEEYLWNLFLSLNSA
ncbi:MAG: hypothetical protein KBC81_00745 [Candidatus Pacebacteria bacterium]|nr:hypothetical protein [Candidatus Paceibacterota bacterium]